MKHLLLFTVILLSGAAFSADTDGEALYKQGLAQLRTAQSDHSALVPAAKLLTQAIAAFEIEKNEAKEAEVNSCLYWAKKKMTLADAEAYKGNADVSKRLEESAKPMPASEAEGMFAKANAFAEGHADDPLLITIHYFEVADRFKDTDSGRKAMESSLKFMQMIGERTKLAAYKPAATDGKAFVASDPPGASIILISGDGKQDLAKKTPSLIQIPQGRQTVELQLAGMKPASLNIEIDGKVIVKPAAVKLEPLTVTRDIVFEEGWHVFIDGMPIKDAKTPCTIETPVGLHSIALAKDGFMDISQRVQIKEDGEKTLEINGRASKGTSKFLKAVQAMASFEALKGEWLVKYNNGADRHFIIDTDGKTKELNEHLSGAFKNNNGKLLLDLNDGKLEEWRVDGVQIEIDHFDPKSDYPKKPKWHGRGTKQ